MVDRHYFSVPIMKEMIKPKAKHLLIISLLILFILGSLISYFIFETFSTLWTDSTPDPNVSGFQRIIQTIYNFASKLNRFIPSPS